MTRLKHLTVAAALLVLVGIASAASTGHFAPRHSSKVYVDPAPLLAKVVGRYGGPSFSRTAFTARPADFRCAEDPHTANGECQTGTWLDVTLPVASDQPRDVMYGEWVSELVAGAVRDLQRAAGGTPLYQLALNATSPQGEAIASDAGVGDPISRTTFRDDAAGSLRAAIVAGAGTAGLRVTAIDVLRPISAAVSVRVQTSDPSAFVANRNTLLNQLLPMADDLEGSFVEVDDTTGKPIFIGYSAQRADVGAHWFRPDLNPSPVPVPSGQSINP